MGEREGGVMSCVWVGVRWEAGDESTGNPENANLWELANIPGRTPYFQSLYNW